MLFSVRRCLPALAFLAVAAATAQSQTTTYSNETSNNTAACSGISSPSYCQGGFVGMSDSASGVYNAVPGNVSMENMHELLYPGNTSKMLTHFQPWFCMQSGSTATGVGTLCNKHLQVGYTSNDSSTVNGQANDMIRRGFDGMVIDWYGTTVNQPYEQTTQKVRDNLAGRCSGPQQCPLYFAIMEDQGSFMWTACPQNGGGVDQTNCIVNALDKDFAYMNTTYFPSNAYLRVDNSTMQISAAGRPVVFFFICEECFTNPTPNWSYIWGQVRAYTNTFGSDTPQIYFVFRNQNGFSHVETNGAFAWVNHYGSNDPYGLVYLDNFYDTALAAISNKPGLITVGAGWKGFDNTNAPWVSSTPSITGQQCGQTWIETFQQPTHNNDFGPGNQLPFSSVVTWNDYEEGSEIETGIDNCLSLAASVSGSVLSWNLNWTASSGSESTVHHYTIFDSTDGQNLTQVATVPTGTHSIDLTTVNLASGSSHTLYVKAVGMPSIMNHMSNAVSYSPAAAVTLASLSVNPASTGGGSQSTGTVTLTATAPIGGAMVGLASSNTAHATVPSAVTVPAGASSATFAVSTNPVSSAQTVLISGNYGGVQKSASLTVTVSIASLTLSPTSVRGGYSSKGTVALTGAAPSGGAVVALSDNSSFASVPGSITVPAGATTASFTISTKRTSQTRYATISGTYARVSKSATLTITH